MRTSSGRTAVAAIAILGLAFYMSAQQNASTARIRVAPDEGQRRVEVVIDGKPFTTYMWPEKLAKPVLYPLRTAKGTVVTRGYPLEPRPGERVDHPHHVGMWFNYGNVNGFDFWNNSEAIKAEDAPKMGNIRHKAITLAKSGVDEGELEIDADWITGKGQVILKEHTRFVFRGGPDFRRWPCRGSRQQGVRRRCRPVGGAVPGKTQRQVRARSAADGREISDNLQ